MHNPAAVLENDTILGLWHTARSPNLGQKTRLNNNQPAKKKENLQNCRLYCPGWSQNKTERKWREG